MDKDDQERGLFPVEHVPVSEQAHPIPGPLPKSQGMLILFALVSSNLFALLLGWLFEFLSLRGVVNVAASRLMLFGAWATGALIVCLWAWGTNIKAKIPTAVAGSILLAALLWGLDAWAPKPSMPVPSSREAEQRKPVGGLASVAPLPKTEERELYDVVFNFKAAPQFTPERVSRIKRDINSLYIYLNGIGFPVEKETPPLGVRNAEIISGTYPGGIYERQLNFSGNDLDRSDRVQRTYADYVFRSAFGLLQNQTLPTERFYHTAASIFSSYFVSSLADRNVDAAHKWSASKWVNGAWGVRQTCGRQLADKILFYTFKTWVAPRSDEMDFDEFFASRISIGQDVADNAGEHSECIAAQFKQAGVSAPTLDDGYVFFSAVPRAQGDLRMLATNTGSRTSENVNIEIRTLPADRVWKNDQQMFDSYSSPRLVHIGDIEAGFRDAPFSLPYGRYYITILSKGGRFNEKLTALKDPAVTGGFRYNVCVMDAQRVLMGVCD